MFQSKEIATLKAALTDAQASSATIAAALSEAQAELASATSINATLSASVEALTTAKAEAEAARANAEAAVIAADARAVAAESAVETQVIERLASAGVDPIKRDPTAKEGGEQTLARAEFDKLDHSARGAFISAGGKVTD
jgi:chromosome segregation ATPase